MRSFRPPVLNGITLSKRQRAPEYPQTPSWNHEYHSTNQPSYDNRFMVWGDVEKMGPALAVAMITILYGYIIKLVTIALTED